MIINYKDIIDCDTLDVKLEQSFSFDEQSGQVTVEKFEGQLIKSDGGYYLRGSMDLTLITVCDRCCESVKIPVNVDVATFISPEQEPIPDVAEYEMQDDDGDVYYFGPEFLDVNELLRQEAILAIPVKRLCNEECKGFREIEDDADELSPLNALSALKNSPKEK